MKYQFEKDQKTSKVYSKEVPTSNWSTEQGGAKHTSRMDSKEVPTSNRSTQQGGANEQHKHTSRGDEEHLGVNKVHGLKALMSKEVCSKEVSTSTKNALQGDANE